ncbi:MAG TPA: FAD-dependent oxidoreductase [Lacipirellulaceae bacterium]|nr:FAD-dependent oxidoreductase [Lacipirellulaceae bacterium]
MVKRVSMFLCSVLVAFQAAIGAEEEQPIIRVGIVGCDTSHVIAFTDAINKPDATGALARCQVTIAFPGGSPDLPSSRDRIEGYVKQLRERGVEIVDSIEKLADKSDAILLESLDGRVHLAQFRAVARGKPVFIDKPAAASAAHVAAIFRYADATKTPCFTSSALRFCDEVQSVANDKSVGEVVGCETVSPMSTEPSHPDLFWYGVHGVEALYAILGPGCQTLTRTDTDSSTVVTGKWSDGRIGTYRGVKEGGAYAATLFGTKGVAHRAGFSGYGPLVEKICRFFITREEPVSRKETLEMFAFMEAADESKRQGGSPVELETAERLSIPSPLGRGQGEGAVSLRNAPSPQPSPEGRGSSFDVVVYGGTSAGIIAAIQAKQMGKKVALIEPSNHLGGLTTGGLGATDIGNKQVIGGLARDFYRRIRSHYESDDAWVHESRDEYNARNPRYNPRDDTMWTFEPHVATRLYEAMLEEAGIEPLINERLDRGDGVKKNGSRIESITMESGRPFAARVFIDATYEGDLMEAAGVEYHVGREANDVYGETLNGVQPKQNVKNHRFTHRVDPFVKPGDPTSGLLTGIQVKELPPDGTGDRCVQAYCYRLCTTDAGANRRPWPKPADYDESRYELLLRNFEAGDTRAPWNPVWMPNRKTDTNNNHAFSTDYIGGSFDYPDADYKTREAIIADHVSYQQGLMWTLANHQRVPKKVRDEFQRLGLAADEFVDNDNWPTQLYVREARRLIGSYVMTEHNCRGSEVVEDPVGMGAYGMDSHNCQRYVTPDGRVENEGDVQVHGFEPYPISYRSIVPKEEQCDNLLVPVCVSSSHIAYGSIRMEPVFMILGQSAATAAAIAIDQNITVQAVPYSDLQARLLSEGQILNMNTTSN